MFLEVLVSCLAGPDEFILWQAQQTLVMFRNPIVIDHCQFKHFAQMISWITFHLLFGQRLDLDLLVAMVVNFRHTTRSAYNLCMCLSTAWVILLEVRFGFTLLECVLVFTGVKTSAGRPGL